MDKMKYIFKNRYGNIRSGWILIFCLLLVYAINFLVSYLLGEIVDRVLTMSGNMNKATNYYSPLAETSLFILWNVFQLITEIITIAVPLVAWKLMKQKWENLGLRDFCRTFKKDGLIGLILGMVNCSVIFVILLLINNVQIDHFNLHFNGIIIWWIFLLMLVGIAEELFHRGFMMSTLRRTNNKYVVLIIPSVMFGCFHLLNPHVTVLSCLNIIFVGFVFSYMYYKSGNLWMCMGYHVTWNIFQAVVYGMPASGMVVDHIVTTHYPTNTIFNGGFFGIEGGILTTGMTFLLLLFVIWYYRNREDQFLVDPNNE